MIQKIELQAEGGNPVQVFPVYDGALVCDEADGLGPVRCQINRSKVGLSDGTRYNSKTLEDRNIVLHWTSTGAGAPVSSAKETLAHTYEPGTQVDVRVETDLFYVGAWVFNGYVEAVTPDLVGDSPESGLEMSIICPNPFCVSRNAKRRQQMQQDGEQLIVDLPGGDYSGSKATVTILMPEGSALLNMQIEAGPKRMIIKGMPGEAKLIKFDPQTKKVGASIKRPQGGGYIYQDITYELDPASDWTALTLDYAPKVLVATLRGNLLPGYTGQVEYTVPVTARNGV